MWTINIFPEKGGDTSLRITILDANKDRSSCNADTRLVNTSPGSYYACKCDNDWYFCVANYVSVEH